MLPCRRGSYLPNWTSFKKAPEDVKTNHSNDAKLDPKTIENSIQINIKITRENLTDLGSPLGTLVTFIEDYTGGLRVRPPLEVSMKSI